MLLTGTGYEFGIDTATAGLVKLVLVATAVPEAGSFAAVGVVTLVSVGGVWIRLWRDRRRCKDHGEEQE